ncbi:gag/pol protein [Cucumis melo var. makuwa]|uniref:Gag/pol protein n=1 Tax=Cucumis melo var. makuwa TaxID=1194695 RepID=A0A5D3D1B7_CUCMM|nr:gag/pol protein [Cucumis melo var. makuwa]TYK18041.1 gag/pol protein [Cucumis melo var. makuwa]
MVKNKRFVGNSIVAFLVLYVDDILLIGNDVGYLTDIKKWLATKFQMKDLEDAQYNSKKGLLPYRYGIHLSKEQCPKTPQEVEDMRKIPYASAVGSLMYAMLWYTDSDFQTDKDARKSTSGSVLTLNGGVVVWRSVKQTCIANSTMEAEYVAAYEAAKEVVWLRKFLTDLEIVPNMHLLITLYCNNSGAVANSREPRSHKRGKHIKRKYHLIREIVHRGDIIVTQISSEQNIVVSFTKALTTKVFEGHLQNLGLRCL